MVIITKFSVGDTTPTEVVLRPGRNTFIPVHTDINLASADSFSYADGLPISDMPEVDPCADSSVWALSESGTRVFFLVHASGC